MIKFFVIVCAVLNVVVTLVYGNEKVDIVAYSSYLLPGEDHPFKYNLLKTRFDVRFHYGLYEYVKNSIGLDSDLKKIIFFDYCEDPRTAMLPKSKMVCFKWEAIKINPCFWNFYSKVYTFDDDLVDNIKFFKFYYPVLQPMIEDLPAFQERNLCVMVAANWVPERIAILDFFLSKPKDSLHAYGHLPLPYSNIEINKGEIPGCYSSRAKLDVLKKYKFCICFENTHTTPGYITEKIFDVFAAGCVPIYWGPDNIEKYIPSDCFIDYRKFHNNQEMYDCITAMSESDHAQYLKNIRQFLQSDTAALFSQENFEKTLYQAVTE